MMSGGVARRVHRVYAFFYLRFPGNFHYVMPGQGVGEILGRGVVAGPGVTAVLQLSLGYHDLCVGEEVGVLGMVPVGVSENNPADVFRFQAMGAKGIHQHASASEVTHIDHRQLFSPDQGYRAKAEGCLVGVDAESG